MATDSPTELRISKPLAPQDEGTGLNLGFTLSFISGRGLLTSRDKAAGPFEVKVLELEIPNIEFPFDVTGGSDRFKTRRCNLRHLAVSLDADGLARALTRPSVEHGGFLEVRTGIRDGYLQLGGRFAIGEHAADFTMRVALLIHSPRELSVVFYDTRMYGWLPVPAALLPVYLNQALQIPFVSATKAGAWTLTPVDDFLRAVLPRAGWKVPDTRHAGLSVADIARGRITLSAGVSRDPNAKQRVEREPPADAVAVGEGIAAFARAEESLARGDFGDAYHRYREALDDERGGRWAQERLLQIGAADPELALETRQLAEEVLGRDPLDVQAHLALAAIAMRERAWGEAATRYARLADIARTENLRYDIVAAELAGAAAAAPVDPATALASYERAAARARDSVIAHQALFEVRQANQDWDGAAKAGERLARLISDPTRASEIHRELGVMHRIHRGDLKRARVHFEKALKIAPDDPAALEGLAETYAARGEPARAATYLARLAEHAEATSDDQRIIGLNLRLGEIWERWLGDEENATRRYQRVLDVDPRNRTARLRLASLAEKQNDWNRARALYEDLLAVEEERGDPDATSDLVQAYTRLARVTLQTDGASPEAIACLERAVELDPSNRPARDELARVMRERGEWSRLAQLLDEAARHSSNFQEARRSRLDAARLQLSHGGDPEAARRHLEAILDRQADDPEALELLVPLLTQNEDVGGLITRLEQAADVTLEPMRRAEHMVALASVREQLGMDPESQRVALEAALDANPYLYDAANRLVALLEDHRDFERLVRALARLSVASVESGVRADALVRRATLLWRELDRVDDAEAAFRKALALVPGDFAAWNQLSRLFESSGKLEQAREALETALAEAVRRGISTAPLYERMAELARSQDDAEHEVEALSNAIRAGLRTDKIAQRLIRVLSQLDRGRDAAELLEEWAGDGETEDNDRLLFQAAELRRSLGEAERASHTFADLVERGGAIARPAAISLERLAFERGDGGRERLALQFLAQATEGDERVAVYERWVNALYRHGERRALEGIARELLELDPRSPVAHYRLAERMESDESFNEALMHYEKLLLETKRERMDRDERRGAFVHASGLAHEVQPNLIPRLQEAFDFEFPEAPDDALDRPLGEVLEAEERWDELYRLRHSQLDWVDDRRRRAYQSDIAELLHHRLGRLEEAIPYYQNVIAGSSDPTGARDALVDVFERLGRWGDLASHLFALSQLAESREPGMAYGLRSARVYGDELGDLSAAQQVLRTLLSDPDEDWKFGGFMDALRDFKLHSELSLLTEKSLEAEPSADDGRLVELVYLLTRVLNDPTRAHRWSEQMVERYPAVDDGWRALTDLLNEYPTLGDLNSTLRRWAQARQGSARAKILVELAACLREDGELDGELETLEEA
ncbi:MAG: tetratricopeptide repeat protein, partial [Myxococcota bacterium]